MIPETHLRNKLELVVLVLFEQGGGGGGADKTQNWRIWKVDRLRCMSGWDRRRDDQVDII